MKDRNGVLKKHLTPLIGLLDTKKFDLGFLEDKVLIELWNLRASYRTF